MVEGTRGRTGLEEGEHGDGGDGGGDVLLAVLAMDEVAAGPRAIVEEHMPGLVVCAAPSNAREDQEGQEDQDSDAADGDAYDGPDPELRRAL